MVIMGNTTVTKQYGWRYYISRPMGYPVYYLIKQVHPKVAVIIALKQKPAGSGMYDLNEIHIRRVVYKHPYTGNPLKAPLDNIAADIEIDTMDNPYPEVVKNYLISAMIKYGRVIKERP